jgi:hypothetical protein
VNAVSLTRRIIVWVVVVSFGIAAILGIAALLTPSFDESAWRVLSTTSVVGAFSALVLCCASLLGRALRVFGLVGVAVSILTMAYAVWTIWWPPEWQEGGWYDSYYRILGTGVAMSIAFAVASLLLLLADRRRAAVRAGLWITLGLFALVLAMVIFVIWARDYDYEVVQRILGILSILAALGAIVVPVISLLLKDDRAVGVTAPGGSPALSAPVTERLHAEAARRGLTADELVTALLDREPPA